MQAVTRGCLAEVVRPQEKLASACRTAARGARWRSARVTAQLKRVSRAPKARRCRQIAIGMAALMFVTMAGQLSECLRAPLDSGVQLQ
jgi:hypothetical protein